MEWNKSVLVGRVLLLLNISVQKGKEAVYFASINFMKRMKPLDKVGRSLGCMCVRWNTGDEVHYNLEAQKDALPTKTFWLGEGSRVKPFDSV